MTSDTTPAPYVVSASSNYSTDYPAWKAFDGTFIDVLDAWATASTTTSGWIKFDFGASTKVDAITLYARYNSNGTEIATPKTFIVYGSDDDMNYEQIVSLQNQIIWNSKEGRQFKFDTSVDYRYYKIVVIDVNGATIAVIGNIKFWQNDGTITYITNKVATMEGTLPSATTLKIKNKKNDPRVGRLGYANDDTNFGTLWIVNKVGESEIPKAKVSSKVLFSGNASTASTNYTIDGVFSEYKSLHVKLITNNGTGGAVHFFIDVTEFIAKGVTLYLPASTTGNAYFVFNYVSDTQFSISGIQLNGFTALGIGMIRGIR
jgi:hypothetical protein